MMGIKQMKNIVEVEVLEIKLSGMLVKVLSNNEIEFIRRRELSWDRRVSVTSLLPQIGQKLKVMSFKNRSGLFLSLRQMSDPWQDADKKFHEKQVVRAEVVNVRHFAAFVQIEPGIDAVIWRREMPLLHEQLPSDVLSIGDRIEGIITEFDSEQKKIEISLTKRLRKLNFAPKKRKYRQLQVFKNRFNPKVREVQTTSTPTDYKPPRLSRYHPPIAEQNGLLIVDDDEKCLQDVSCHLESNFQFNIDCVQSGSEALSNLQEGLDYDIAVVDLNLKNECGITMAKQLLHLKPNLAIIFTSANAFVEQEKLRIGERKWPFAFKDPEHIADWVEKLYNGYRETALESAKQIETGQTAFIRQLGMSALTRRSLPEVLQEMLAKLRLETGLSQAVVVEVDSINRQVSILAAEPALDEEIEYYTLDGLYYSPVREVVEEEKELYRTHINEDDSSRFKNFFRLLAFQTCFGIPLKIPDFFTRHALFLFDETQVTLSEESRNQARTASQLIQVALERALLLDYMRRYEQRYTLGQLLGSLVHELHNKLDGLGASGFTLSTLLQNTNSMNPIEGSNQINTAIQIANQITQAKNELGELVEAYSRLASGDLEAVDVNKAIRKVKRQMEYKGREASVEIDLDLQKNLPLARSIESRLMQIISNIVLNAIQQIEAQAKRMRQIAQQEDHHEVLLQSGLVMIQTQYHRNSSNPLQINIFDTGPGIHYKQQERIFLLDTSTRQKGQGLGLYISRNLAETMGGRLRLTDSIMFIGSRFVVELPQY